MVTLLLTVNTTVVRVGLQLTVWDGQDIMVLNVRCTTVVYIVSDSTVYNRGYYQNTSLLPGQDSVRNGLDILLLTRRVLRWHRLPWTTQRFSHYILAIHNNSNKIQCIL